LLRFKIIPMRLNIVKVAITLCIGTLTPVQLVGSMMNPVSCLGGNKNKTGALFLLPYCKFDF